jgi:D-sedoheptulose 7-phosphate isomerase
MVSAHLNDHLNNTREALRCLYDSVGELECWAADLTRALLSGHKLLAAGNGGSAAEAQHLTAELVGRYRAERRPLSAIPLHTDGSSVTAIGNDYGVVSVYARQVQAHGAPGDVLMLLSTSGQSENLLAAAMAAHDLGVASWALTGPSPNPLAEICDRALTINAPTTAAVQEMHLVAIHLLCDGVDRHAGAVVDREVEHLTGGTLIWQ